MKIVFISLVWFALNGFSRADYVVPKNVFRVSQLAEVMAQAKAEGKAISFVLSHQRTNSEKCGKQTLECFQELGAHSLVMFVDSELDEEYMLPPLVLGKLRDPRHGRIIPWVSTFSPDLLQPWGDIRHIEVDGPGSNKFFRLLTEKVRTRLTNLKNGKPTTADPSIPIFPLRWAGLKAPEYWFGNFVKIDDKMLTLSRDGEDVTIFRERLAPLAIAYAELLGGRTVTPTEEPWTNLQGKAISATFAKLSGDTVVLKLPDGKEVKVPISSLAPESQARAQELGK